MPESTTQVTPSRGRTRRMLGLCLSLLGLGVVIYGATAFWLLNSLPPNGGENGRLPSLYVMGVGIVATVIGLAIKDLRTKTVSTTTSGQRAIPTSLGLLVIVVLLALVMMVISQL